jgi:hypothetical protein
MAISFKTSIYVFLSSLVLTIIIAFIYYKNLTLLTFINTSFIISSLLLFCGLFMLVAKGGFFDGITFGFRRFLRNTSKTEQMLGDDIETMALPSQTITTRMISPILISGAMLFCIMLLSLFLYYLLIPN